MGKYMKLDPSDKRLIAAYEFYAKRFNSKYPGVSREGISFIIEQMILQDKSWSDWPPERLYDNRIVEKLNKKVFSKRSISRFVRGEIDVSILRIESAAIPCGLDLREFLTRVKATGELQEISGAHWNLEIGALTELFAERTPTPALLFDAVAGYAKGKRVLSNILFSPLRQSLALGVAPEIRGIALVQALKSRLAELTPIPPVEAKYLPVLENVLEPRAYMISNMYVEEVDDPTIHDTHLGSMAAGKSK